MRTGFLGALVALVAGSGLAPGQTADMLPPPRMVPAAPAADSETMTADVTTGSVPADMAVPEGSPFTVPGTDGHPAAHSRLWFSAEYLLWWFKGQQVPALVTTGPAVTVLVPGPVVPFGPPPLVPVPSPFAGAVGTNGTKVLFGAGEINEDSRSGGRFTGGWWLDDAHSCAVEGSYFFLGERTNQSLFGPELSVLARPFFDLNTGAEAAALVTFPGQSRGSVLVSAPSELWGTEANVLKKLCACDCHYQIDWLTGVRFLDLKEDIAITQTQDLSTGLLPGAEFFPLAGQHLVLTDRFATENRFYGGQFGLDLACYCGPWALEVRGKLGLGDTHEDLAVIGSQAATTAGGKTTVASAGLLALPTNSGRFSQDEFAVLPEATVHVGYRVCDWLCLFTGFDLLYWSQVVRPGDQIDRVIDVSQVPNFAPAAVPTGVPRPATQFKQTDFWAAGIDFGMEFVW